jgi:hypothetical protein
VNVLYKYQIHLETCTDIDKFVKIAESLPYDVAIENEDGTKRGNAKTLLNVVDAITYDKIYILSNNDMYTPFRNYIANES